MRVLTIDLDYITTDYSRFLDQNYFSLYSYERWDNLFNNTPLIPADFHADHANFIFLFDLYTKALKTCRNVVFGQEHDSILYELKDSTEKIDLINLDQHHDIMYSEEDLIKFAKFNYTGEGIWVWYLDQNRILNSYTWIKTPTSEDYNYEQATGNYRGLPELNCNFSTYLRTDCSNLTDYKFDLIYISLSPQYVSPQHWFFGDILITNYKNYYETMPKFINQKFGSDLSQCKLPSNINLNRYTLESRYIN